MLKPSTLERLQLSVDRLKKRLAVARRGHKLLKDKRDELMKRFLDLVRPNRDLRQAISEGRFKINPEAIADRLIESARDLLNSNGKRQA